MTHPAEITEAWQALAAATDSPALTEPMRCIAAVLEAAGLKVSVVDGVLYADDVNVDPDTGIADCTASFRVEQEN
ncbi:MAG TPA: hypothetical protein VG502_00920 [Flexivirga sp.]|uniref:hypothetical protein n=1 Tax=Flexivirga sp. TaxID=1962927 RepID=UPI002C551673|nr:hypothetical protein [Flexivirga sp.]HWC20835.1 hypothetical protein [Flexivirga sp.]